MTSTRAALLEQERPNIFTQSVANIKPGHEIEVVIHYVQQLTQDAGEYEFVFPMVIGPRFIPGEEVEGAPGGSGWSPDTDLVPDASRITRPILGRGMRRGDDISLEVTVNAGFELYDLSTPTHKTTAEEHDELMLVKLSSSDSIPNRDFVMRYRVDKAEPQVTTLAHRDPKAEGDRGEGFLSLMIQPPTTDLDREVGRRELIFVIDVSGSMSGEPLLLAKNALRAALNQTRPVDVFNVITFAGYTGKLFSKPRPANDLYLTQALRYIERLGAGGGTMMDDAVKEALSSEVTEGYHRYVFFLTDGQIGNEGQIFESAQRLVTRLKERGQRARVFSFGVGDSPNRHLLKGIAESGDGLSVNATKLEGAARAVNLFYRMIDLPIISDLKIDWGGLPVNRVTPQQLPDLFATRPLIINARYRGAASGVVKISGRRGGQPFTLKLPIKLPEAEPKNTSLATLWARDQIADEA